MRFMMEIDGNGLHESNIP